MPPQMMKRWFGGGPKVDQEIASIFKKDLENIGHGIVKHWQGDRDGVLATIILCDQFSRNIYRGLAEAFSFDHISLKLAKILVSKVDTFKQYKNFERLFIIMPLMHSENVDDCQLCVDIIQGMIDDFNAEGLTDLSKIFIMNKKWALEHLEIL